jgi:hypothetical protein
MLPTTAFLLALLISILQSQKIDAYIPYLAESSLNFSMDLNLGLESNLLGLEGKVGPQHWTHFSKTICSLGKKKYVTAKNLQMRGVL